MGSFCNDEGINLLDTDVLLQWHVKMQILHSLDAMMVFAQSSSSNLFGLHDVVRGSYTLDGYLPAAADRRSKNAHFAEWQWSDRHTFLG